MLNVWLTWLLLSHFVLADVPHISECKLCDECIVDATSHPSTRYQLVDPANGDSDAVTEVIRFGKQRIRVPNQCLWDYHSIQIGPPNTAHDAPTTLHCPKCRGCTAILTNITSKPKVVANIKYTSGIGGTDNWLFYGTKPGSDAHYIVKTSCIPISKVNAKPKQCNPRTAATRLQTQVAQYRLAQDCGLGHLLHKIWIEHTTAIIPGIGHPVSWDMLWMEEARGLSLHALYMHGQRSFTQELLSQKLNSSQLIEASVWDLLVNQCDRHIENVFIDVDGSLQLIDHDKALGNVPGCGANSMLLPGNGFNNILRTKYISKSMTERAKKLGQCSPEIDPRIVLDYRCHVPDGRIGTAFPASVQRCLAHIDSLSPAQLCSRYGLPTGMAAVVLKTRARDMLTRGFEWTLQHGLPRNQGKLVLQAQPPCCQLALREGSFFCGHCWEPLKWANATYNHFAG